MRKIESKVIKILKNEGVGILPTDTLYGLVGSALSKKAVQRICKLKKRSPNKPFIVLISKPSDLKIFGLGTGGGQERSCPHYWPGKVSIVLKCPNLNKAMSYLRPKDKTLAFRCPEPKWLHALLEKTGPLVAPTANPEGLPPAQTINQARKYFGKAVDFYVDRGRLKGLSSTLIEIQDDKTVVRRQGAIKI